MGREETEYNRVKKKLLLQNVLLMPLFVSIGLYVYRSIREGFLMNPLEFLGPFIIVAFVGILLWSVFRERMIKQEQERIANKGTGKNVRNNIMFFAAVIVILIIIVSLTIIN
ncbi:hypothetical protein HUG15_04305 [Salicibibacter cibarius]|uniref:Uncharacterized protein n=1 Tax=Salicibibacter cibarius TaxID=2743000 RepID=A0A7T7CAI7_9BACI|nr:hypothetical protein [Salicibibacter cibarius]QQK74900.1 hypothetical protein HUG15_04305 [Salicibibacter cibarius]